MTSPRHQLTDRILDKMRQKGIKPTHLRGYFCSTAIKRFQNYKAPFVTLHAIEDVVDEMFTKRTCPRYVNALDP